MGLVGSLVVRSRWKDQRKDKNNEVWVRMGREFTGFGMSIRFRERWWV